MKRIFEVAICALLFMACETQVCYDDPKLSLKKDLHGKYKLESSVSEKEVDLNNDGISSKDLLSENSMIALSEIVIVGIGHESFFKDEELYYSISWPIENSTRFTAKEILISTLPPIRNPHYDTYLNSCFGKIDDDLKTIRLYKDIEQNEPNTLIDVESLVIEEEGSIRFTSTRKLFTSAGWTTTKIVSIYKQYSNSK